jgi:lysophospholipid acyltransferase (LPLAT)-like uncharacterized protein
MNIEEEVSAEATPPSIWGKIKGLPTRFKRWFVPLFVAYFVDAFLLRGILATCKIEIVGLERFLSTASSSPTILACWHNRLPLCSYAIWRWASHLNFDAVISHSGDGKIVNAIVERLSNMRIISVPHDARHQALRQIIQTLKVDKRILLVTPDGPRGPRYRCKPGTVVAAEAADATVFGATWSASRFFQLSSWDKMMFPLPFSHIIIRLSEPITFDSEDTLKGKREHLDEQLVANDVIACNSITEDCHRWPS